MSVLIFDQVYVWKEPVMELTPTMTMDLIAYAEGRALDEDTVEALASWLYDLIDRELEGEYVEAADDLEALMRRYESVAWLVANKTDEKRLHKRICAFIHGHVFGEERIAIERMIEVDPGLADLVGQLRELKPDVEAAFRSLEDEPLSLKLFDFIKTCPLGGH